jgi:uncharacterized protein YhjY with autotransporter beta-barrel domain
MAYRLTPQLRVGTFLDQRVDDSLPGNYRLRSSQPLLGAFVGWRAQDTGLGPQVKASWAFSRQHAAITRTPLSHTEAGRGQSVLQGQGVQLEGAYGLALDDTWQARPFLGLKHTRNRREGYTETRGADFAMSYQGVQSKATSAYAGSELIGRLTPAVTLTTRLGLEQDLSRSSTDYTSQADYLGGFRLKAADEQRTRGFVSVGGQYDLGAGGVIALGLGAAQQALDSSVGYSATLSYSLGF